jgi:nitroreductase
VTHAVNDDALDILFRKARTHRAWRPGNVTPQMLMAIYDLARWGPTTNNTSPMRVVFVISPDAKERLKPHLSKGNVEQTMKAPATAILGAALDARLAWTMPEPVSLESDPVIELYKRDVDRTLLRENLKLTPEQRLRKLQDFVALTAALQEAGRKARA